MVQIVKLADPSYWSHHGGTLQTELMEVASRACGAPSTAFVLSDDKSDPEAPVAMMLFMEPNFELPRHAHDCHRFEVVVQGTLTIGDTNLGPGDISISSPGEHYGPHIAGPTGCLTVEIFTRQTAIQPDHAEATFSAKHHEVVARSKEAVAAFLENRPSPARANVP